MIRGLYSAANGILVQSLRTDAISANLAGLSVPGYRRDVPAVSALLAPAGGVEPRNTLLSLGTTLDLQPGPLRRTGGDLDLALDGPGYFCVGTPAGEAYTRTGSFRLSPEGWLETASGNPLTGRAGPLRVSGGDVEIGGTGEVVVDGVSVDRLRIVNFPPGTTFLKLGDGLMRPSPGAGAVPTDRGIGAVRQGYLEQSNVNAISELAAMITSLRAFEASQRALQANDQTLETAINEIARVQ